MGWWTPIVSAGIGALGSYFGAKEANKPRKSFTDQTTTVRPWDQMVPFLDFIADNALLNFFNAPTFAPEGFDYMEYAPGRGIPASMMADYNAYAALAKAPIAGAGLIDDAKKYIDEVLNTDVAQNPYLGDLSSGMRENALRDFLQSGAGNTVSRFTSAGRFGSALSGQAAAGARTDLISDLNTADAGLRSNAFETWEQSRRAAGQLTAAIESVMNQRAAIRRSSLANLTGLGLQMEQMRYGRNQAYKDYVRNWQLAEHEFNESLPNDQLARLAQFIMPIAGMGQTTQTTGTNVVPGIGASPLGSAFQGGLGGFMTGYGTARDQGWIGGGNGKNKSEGGRV